MRRNLLVTMVAAGALFLAALIYVNVVGDIRPQWLWGFAMAALVLPPAVVAVSLVLLLQHRRSARQAGA
jgi:ABC-type Fe3+ transport system permease subunit